MIQSSDLTNRAVGEFPGADAAAEDVRRGRRRKPAAEDDPEDSVGPDLAQRLAAARSLRPQGDDLHCADCWQRGRDAALRAIEGGEEGGADRSG